MILGRWLLFSLCLIGIITLAAMPEAHAALVFTGEAGIAQQVTPTAESAQPGAPRATSPIVGILVLMSPALWLVWKAYKVKKLQKVKASCCLPVMDEQE